MEKQYILFNSGKPFLLFIIGFIGLLFLVGWLAYIGVNNKLLIGLIAFVCMGLLTWLSFKLDQK